MARHGQLIASAALCVAALFTAPAVAAADACDETVILEYDVQGGGYQFAVNGIYLDHGGGQFASGGAPIQNWFLKGENTVTAVIDAERGEFQLFAICDDGSARRDFDSATLTGAAKTALTFQMPDPPPRAYLDAPPTEDDGLLEAVQELQRAFSTRDFETVWKMHGAMRRDFEMAGKPLEAEAWRMEKIVGALRPVFADRLEPLPVLGGRVWEVLGANFEPPISGEAEVNGGVARFQTGVFWMRGPDGWSVLAK